MPIAIFEIRCIDEMGDGGWIPAECHEYTDNVLESGGLEEPIVGVLKKPLNASRDVWNAHYAETCGEGFLTCKLPVEFVVKGAEFRGLVVIQECVHRFRSVRNRG